LADFFNPAFIENLGRKSGFVQRKSKLTTYSFLNLVLFAHQPGRKLSLLDLVGELYQHFGLSFTKQSLQNRFNHKAVRLLKAVLSHLLNLHIPSDIDKGIYERFNRVRIKDSTRFALPERYAERYQGYGGVTNFSAAMISIQYEYDLLSGTPMDARLTSGLSNDQSDSRDHTHDIAEGDLFIRDLGYCTADYMKKIDQNGAFFVNRLAPQIKIYYADQPDKELDLKACVKKLKRYNLPYLEYHVLLGKEAKLAARLILSCVDQQTYQKRIKKTQKQARSYGHQVSDNFRNRAKLNLFVTNTEADDLPAQHVQPTYSLRWQIELIFKVWKSQARINDLKEVKIDRFECQLLGKLIWLLLHWKLYCWLDHNIIRKKTTYCGSLWKYYKLAFNLSGQLRRVSLGYQSPETILSYLKNIPIKLLALEKKKGKTSYYQKLKPLNSRLWQQRQAISS